MGQRRGCSSGLTTYRLAQTLAAVQQVNGATMARKPIGWVAFIVDLFYNGVIMSIKYLTLSRIQSGFNKIADELLREFQFNGTHICEKCSCWHPCVWYLILSHAKCPLNWEIPPFVAARAPADPVYKQLAFKLCKVWKLHVDTRFVWQSKLNAMSCNVVAAVQEVEFTHSLYLTAHACKLKRAVVAVLMKKRVNHKTDISCNYFP